jgi:hypothetical protein
MQWWKRCHSELSLRTSQALEAARASGLCKKMLLLSIIIWKILQAFMIIHLNAYGTTMSPAPKQVTFNRFEP